MSRKGIKGKFREGVAGVAATRRPASENEGLRYAPQRCHAACIRCQISWPTVRGTFMFRMCFRPWASQRVQTGLKAGIMCHDRPRFHNWLPMLICPAGSTTVHRGSLEAQFFHERFHSRPLPVSAPRRPCNRNVAVTVVWSLFSTRTKALHNRCHNRFFYSRNRTRVVFTVNTLPRTGTRAGYRAPQ